MFPHKGEGFIWEHVSTVSAEDLAIATIFVPESKRLFEVSFSTKESGRANLYPTTWIEWTSVGKRDLSKPYALEGVSIMDDKKDRCIRPEYTNQTTFKSMLLFPDREDLVRFVGKHNAWSPHVGIVVCEEPEVTRGTYCFGYIERMARSTGSEFCVNSDTLKYPDGYFSDRDRIIFEGLAKEIEMAAEEAAVLASKGRTPGDDCQIIPARRKEVDDDFGGYEKYGQNPRAVKTNLKGPGWTKFKSKEHIKDIQNRAEFIKNNRFNDIIVYKVSSNGRGFVGFTPLIGSVDIIATQHKNSDRKVKVGDTVSTRIEYNKRSLEFVVESIADIGVSHLADFELRNTAIGCHLILKCKDLDLREWKALKVKGDRWNGKKWGVVEHPVLQRVLVPEDIAMHREWAGKKVTCDILHYEEMENQTPERIRLILERVDHLFDDGSIDPIKVDFPSGRPDHLDSDVEEDDDEEEEDEGRGQSYGEEGEEEGRRNERGPAGDAFTRQPLRSAFANSEEYSSGGGFLSNTWPDQRGDDGRRYDTNERGGRGHEDRGRDTGRGGGRGRGAGGGRGGGGWGNQRHSSNGSSPDPWQGEGHGFGSATVQKPSMSGEGFVVVYSRRDSYIYMRNHQIVKYEGDIENIGMSLGDSAKFGMEPSRNSNIPFTVVHGHIHKIPDLFPDFFKPRKMIYNNELYIRVQGVLTPQRTTFECHHISDVKLDAQRQDLKLFSREFVKRTRLIVDHPYDIYVKLCSETWSWQFECIDEEADSFQLEDEDEIDRVKRMNLAAEKRPSSRSSRSGDESSWENVQSVRSGSSKGVGYSSRGSDLTSGNRDRDDRPKFSRPSKAPSVVSSMASTQFTATTMTSEKELKETRRKLEIANRMLKSVWDYKHVQKTVKMDNFFLYESVDDYVNTLAEDESERNQ